MSPSFLFRPVWSMCKAAANLKTVVVVPVLPVGISAADVVTNARLKEVFVDSSLSLSNFFKEMSIAAGVVRWAGPDVVIWSEQLLPKSISDYTANGTVPIGSTIFPDIISIKNSIQATNPVLYGDRNAVFVFVVMGAPGGGEAAQSIIRVSGKDLLPGTLPEEAIGPAIHEIGHRLGLLHAAAVTLKTPATPDCAATYTLPFGTDPFSTVRLCGKAHYGDSADVMAAGNVRPYSAFSRALLFGEAPVVLSQSAASKQRAVRLYASSYVSNGSNPGNWGGANAQIIKFRLDAFDPGGDSYYYLEYRNGTGFSDPVATGAGCSLIPGVYVRFRPGVKVVEGDWGTVQTYIPTLGCTAYSIATPSNTIKYDTTSGLTIQVTNMTVDFADVVLTWK